MRNAGRLRPWSFCIVIAAALLGEPSAPIGVVKIIGILGLLTLGPPLAFSKEKTDA